MAPGSVTGSRQSLDLDAENHAALCDRSVDVMLGVTVSYYENPEFIADELAALPAAGIRNMRSRLWELLTVTRSCIPPASAKSISKQPGGDDDE